LYACKSQKGTEDAIGIEPKTRRTRRFDQNQENKEIRPKLGWFSIKENKTI
jgi:hypothetical protein